MPTRLTPAPDRGRQNRSGRQADGQDWAGDALTGQLRRLAGRGLFLDAGDPTVEAWRDGAPVFSTTPESVPPEPPQSGRRRVAVAFIG